MAKRKNKKKRVKKDDKSYHLFGLTRSTERITSILLFFTILVLVTYNYSHIPNSWVIANLATAVTGTLLIGLSFVLGPIYRWLLPGKNPGEYRKMFGMLGFAVIAIHVLISFSYRSASTFAPGNELSIVAAAISFIIFAILAASSSGLVMKSLGYTKWLAIQRTGYAALVLDIIHFALIGKERFLLSTMGEIVVVILLLALAARLVRILQRK